MKRVVIVDDHPVMRHGLRQLIESVGGLEVCAEAGSAAEGRVVVGEHCPDLVIVDISLPDGSGLELIKDFKAVHPEVKALVISSHDESLYAERSLRAGALGYVMKEEAPDKLLQAIGDVAEGRLFVSEKMSKTIIDLVSGRGSSSSDSPIDVLSDRELEVFQLIGEGLGTREIARRLNVSVSTIDAHRAHIKKKLNLADGNALVRQAVRWVESSRLN